MIAMEEYVRAGSFEEKVGRNKFSLVRRNIKDVSSRLQLVEAVR